MKHKESRKKKKETIMAYIKNINEIRNRKINTEFFSNNNSLKIKKN